MKSKLFVVFLFTCLISSAQTVIEINGLTPGALTDSLSSDEKNTVTDLILSGTIDARDFKLLGDNFPLMTNLDIQNCTIVEYRGNGGPSPFVRNYPVDEIPASSFSYPSNITNILLPLTLKSIGASSFQNSRLENITIPNTVTYIGENAFYGTYQLKNIYIPESVTFIGYRAFDGIAESIIVDSNNNNYTSINNVLYDKNLTTLIRCPFAYIGNHIIPEGVQEISDCAFYGNYNIDTLFVPSTVEKIYTNTFATSSVKTIVDAGNQHYASIDGVLFNKDITTLIHISTSIEGSYIIPNTVQTIGEFAFYKSKISCVNIPNSVTSIEYFGFAGSHNLISIKIPESVSIISESCFADCEALLTISIPSSIDTICTGAFNNYNMKPESIYCYATTPPVNSGWGAFNDVTKQTCILYVPHGTSELYENAFDWKDFATIVEMPFFELEIQDTELSSSISTTEISIATDTIGVIHTDSDWITLSVDSLINGQNIIIVTADENTNSEYREAIIIIEIPGMEPVLITIIQQGQVIESLITSENKKYTLYPNPATNYINIDNCDNCIFEMYSIEGQKVLQYHVKNDINIPLHGLKKGVYFYEIYNQNTSASEILIIK